MPTFDNGPVSPFTEEEEYARKTVRAFLDKELEPHHEKFIGDLEYDRAFWRKAGQAGILGSVIPEEYGGPGLSELFAVIISQELGRSIGGATIGSSLSADLATHILMEFGPEDKKREYAERILAGEISQAVGITEPGAGSDVTAMTTTAIRHGDEYVVNGSKVFISNANKAELLYLVAKTDPAKRGSGMSILMIEGTPAGMTRRRLPLMGCPAYDLAELHFDEVRVPAGNRLLDEGQAMRILMSTFTLDRLQVAARALGEAELAYALTVEQVKNRAAFGQKVFDFQNTKFVLADMRTEIEVGRSLLYDGIRRYRAGVFGFDDAAMIKLWIPQMTGRVVDQAVQLFGGSGYMDEMPISRIYTANRLHRIYAGTDEQQKIAISKSI
ncbi:acyl-CoA dehydrogenase family protein [Nocardia sp. NPDC050799]|uniref:acyl-CoA dehydrogenase family protein n=1 Tax=Nocardia sp. NPDC050799 TaxID=3154842 RepID=UPI0033CE6D96